eukprot:s5799_g1.t1
MTAYLKRDQLPCPQDHLTACCFVTKTGDKFRVPVKVVLGTTGFGRKADIWSFGCTVLEAMTAEPPWGKGAIDGAPAAMRKIGYSTDTPPIPDPPPQLGLGSGWKGQRNSYRKEKVRAKEGTSSGLLALLQSCLQRSADLRPTATELLSCEYFMPPVKDERVGFGFSRAEEDGSRCQVQALDVILVVADAVTRASCAESAVPNLAMVDYSKWNDLDVSDDEERRRPHVSKFDTPQTVTIGRQEVQAAQAQDVDMEADDDDEPFETEDDAAEPGEDRREDVLQCRALAERALRNGDAAEGVRLLEKAMRLGGSNCPGVEELLRAARVQLGSTAATAQRAEPEHAKADPQQNGGTVEGRYIWSQTKEAVEINLFVPPDTKAKDIKVEVSDLRLRIAGAGQTLLEGDWEFKVSPEEDADWELVTCHERRALRLLVRKAG